MTLPIREKLAMLVPPSLFYPRRISEQARSGEPELAVLAKLVPGGGTAVDRCEVAPKCTNWLSPMRLVVGPYTCRFQTTGWTFTLLATCGGRTLSFAT